MTPFSKSLNNYFADELIASYKRTGTAFGLDSKSAFDYERGYTMFLINAQFVCAAHYDDLEPHLDGVVDIIHNSFVAPNQSTEFYTGYDHAFVNLKTFFQNFGKNTKMAMALEVQKRRAAIKLVVDNTKPS